MISKSTEKKIQRKQKRCQHLIAEETKIACSDIVTKNLVICNAGLSTSLKQDYLLENVQLFGKITEIIMLPGKSYCFLKCPDEQNAAAIFAGMHGKAKLAQNDGILYLSYTLEVPRVENPYNRELPPGLILLEDFIDETEELDILNCIDWTSNETIGNNVLKYRQVKHYGYEFLYGSNNVDIDNPLKERIPKKCDFLWTKLEQKLPDLRFIEPEQLTVNKYEPGQGIPPHVDTHSAFTHIIMSLSLTSDISMEFRSTNGRHLNVYLPRRSLLIMSEESRYGWTHGITPRMTDIVLTKDGNLTVNKRGIRVSLTFRSLNPNAECHCQFPSLCDTFKNNETKKHKEITENPSKLELENVHKVYDEIATHFSETRHSPWPAVENFVASFEPGQILIDIGCGNGKYLGINKDILKIGCDRSHGLLSVCLERGLNVFQCDCLHVPLRSNSADGCISIAVIHHLASETRRIQAVSEMHRILIRGGRGLIYVWAKDQQLKNKKSSYLRQNKHNNKPGSSDATSQNQQIEYSDGLPIHVNRTQFIHQDVLVPWKLKDNSTGDCRETFLRFYHVFEENELTKMCDQIAGVKILRSFYDQGNWCIEFQKQ